MPEALRLFFLAFYAISILVLLVRVLPLSFRAAPAEQGAQGATRYLPVLLLPMGFLVPPLAMLTRAGEIDVAWWPVRVTGLLLGLYAAVILPWSASMLGRFLVPQARVSCDHELVVEGPFQFVPPSGLLGRPGALARQRAGDGQPAHLASLPLYVLGATLQSCAEDDLLASKFGDDYRRYAARVGRFVPRLAH